MRKKVNASYDASNVDDIPIGLLQRHGTFRRTTIAPIERPSEYTQKKISYYTLHTEHNTNAQTRGEGGKGEREKGRRNKTDFRHNQTRIGIGETDHTV